MAICNLFNDLTKNTGNFLMFSQYTEDLSRYVVEHESYKVVPSKFLAFNIDYTNVKNNINIKELNTGLGLNSDIPKYFQNYFENSCAYLRGLSDWAPYISSNLLWRTMVDMGMITLSEETEDKNSIVNELRYVGDINIQSHDSIDGNGYGEIYCHIPVDAAAYEYHVKVDKSADENPITNSNNNLEGWDIPIGKYSNIYYPYKKYIFEFDPVDYFDNPTALLNPSINRNYPESYDINTIVILYDIYIQNLTTGEWVKNEYNKNIPLGIYFAGVFNDTQISNPIKKYVTNEDVFGLGTSYGLRICTRFTTTPDSNINMSDVHVSSENTENYSAFCRVMTEMSEVQSKMNEVVNSIIRQSQDIKDSLAIFKNNKVNVPYIKMINGANYWFVNGKCIGIATTSGGGDCNCTPAEQTDIREQIDIFENTFDN